MTQPDDTPKVTAVLLQYLDRVYPNTLPADLTITAERLRFLQGQRTVVDHLKHLHLQSRGEA